MKAARAGQPTGAGWPKGSLARSAPVLPSPWQSQEDYYFQRDAQGSRMQPARRTPSQDNPRLPRWIGVQRERVPFV